MREEARDHARVRNAYFDQVCLLYRLERFCIISFWDVHICLPRHSCIYWLTNIVWSNNAFFLLATMVDVAYQVVHHYWLFCSLVIISQQGSLRRLLSNSFLTLECLFPLLLWCSWNWCSKHLVWLFQTGKTSLSHRKQSSGQGAERQGTVAQWTNESCSQ